MHTMVCIKAYWKINTKDIEPFLQNTLKPVLCGYMKGCCTQYVFFFKLIESLKKYWQDNNGFSTAVFMDESKAFDTISHDLLFAKL